MDKLDEEIHALENDISIHINQIPYILDSIYDSDTTIKELKSRLQSWLDQPYDWQSPSQAMDTTGSEIRSEIAMRLLEIDYRTLIRPNDAYHKALIVELNNNLRLQTMVHLCNDSIVSLKKGWFMSQTFFNMYKTNLDIRLSVARNNLVEKQKMIQRRLDDYSQSKDNNPL
jgi:hypothetical protein